MEEEITGITATDTGDSYALYGYDALAVTELEDDSGNDSFSSTSTSSQSYDLYSNDSLLSVIVESRSIAQADTAQFNGTLTGTYTDDHDHEAIYADAIVSGASGKDAVISGYSWANDGTGLTLDFNFYTSLPGAYAGLSSDLNTGFQAMNAAQANASRAVLGVIEQYINVNFNEVGSGASADLSFGQVARGNTNIVAHAFYPTGSAVDGDVFLNTAFWGYENAPTAGSLVYETLFHEIGHALGLKHTFDTGGTGDTLGADDNNTWSVMSYTTVGGNAMSMMIYDIAALQELYGVNTSYNTGNNTYTMQGGAHFTIWDAGGTDTLDGAAQSANLTINLQDGTQSLIGTTRIGIAFNAVIENANGGSGNDTIYGNSANNILKGGAGTDTLYASTGNDTLNGEGGTDTANYSSYSVTAFAFNFIDTVTVAFQHIAQSWTDTLINIENFIFSDGSYTFADLKANFAPAINDFAPTVTTANVSLAADASVLVSTIISASDADGNDLTYEVWDGGAALTTGYFDLNDTRLDSGSPQGLTQSQFDQLRIVGGDLAGTEKMWVRASDGVHTTAWKAFTLETTSSNSGGANSNINNFAPTVTANNLTLDAGQTALASSVISASDADGNTLSYIVWDGGSTATSGYFDLNGSELTAGVNHTLTAAEFAQLNIVGGDVDGTEKLWVKVSDGVHTTSWKAFTLETDVVAGVPANDFAPTVTANSLYLSTGQTALASSVISASDADGNTLSYIVWDGGTANDTGYFQLNGTKLAANTGHTLTEAEFAQLDIVGGMASGDEKFWVRVSDGDHVTSWTAFTLTSGNSSGGSANDFVPTVTANNLSVNNGDSVLASTVISAADADGNTLSYEVWDGGTGSTSGYFDLNGTKLSAGGGHLLTAAEFSQLTIVGGDVGGTENLWARVSDGDNTTAWKKFTLTTIFVPSYEANDILDMGDSNDFALALDNTQTAASGSTEAASSGGSEVFTPVQGFEEVNSTEFV